MAVNLKKGGRVNLTKNTNLKKAMLGLGWDTNKYKGPYEFDLDLVLFLCDRNKKCLDESHIIFYNNVSDPAKSVVHSGDNRTGEGEGDDETATIEFAKIPKDVKYIIVVVTIFDAERKNQNFGLVDNSFARMVNIETGEEMLRYDLGEDFSTQTSVVFAEIYRTDDGKEWKFRAIGEGYEKDLEDLCIEYGLTVEDEESARQVMEESIRPTPTNIRRTYNS